MKNIMHGIRDEIYILDGSKIIENIRILIG